MPRGPARKGATRGTGNSPGDAVPYAFPRHTLELQLQLGRISGTRRHSALLPSWRPWTRPAASNCLKIPTRAALHQVPSSGNDLSGHQVSCCGGLEG